MKKYILLSLFIISQQFAFGQWQSLGSGITASPRTVIGISVVDSNTVWGVARHPTSFVQTFEFTKTSDGGASWQSGILDIDPEWYVLQIFGLNADTAWLAVSDEESPVISGRVFKTTDGGTSWQEQSSAFAGENETPVAVHFFDSNNGFTYGATGEGTTTELISIYTTEDGGENWSKVTGDSMPDLLPGEGTWIYSGNGSYEVLGDHIWFGSNKGRVFHSADRGKTWEVNATGLGEETVSSVAFQDARTGLALFPDLGQAAKTTNGGSNWTKIELPQSINPTSIEYIPESGGTYLITDGIYSDSEMLITHDSGESWQIVSVSPSMESVEFLSPAQGWGGGLIASPNEGGVFRWAGEPLVDTIELLFENELIENFEAQPADWKSDYGWEIGKANALSSPAFSIPGNSTVAALNDDEIGIGRNADERLISPPIFIDGTKNHLLELDVFFTNGDFRSDERAMIEWSPNGIHWTSLHELKGASDWQKLTLPLLEEQLGDTLYLAFRYDDGNAQNTGFAVDNIRLYPAPNFYALVETGQLSDYTVLPKDQVTTMNWQHTVLNAGNSNLGLMQLKATVRKDGVVLSDTIRFLPLLAPGEDTTWTFSYLPNEVGVYDFEINASQAALGTGFYKATKRIEISAAMMARDDNTPEGTFSFPLVNRTWYGFHGTRFHLSQQDTLTAVSTYIRGSSDNSESSRYDFIIATFNELGNPVRNFMFEKRNIQVPAGFVGWHTFELDEPLVLPAMSYIFGIGHAQRVLGSFPYLGGDRDGEPGSFYNIHLWSNSNWRFFEQLDWVIMIRPQFATVDIPVGLDTPTSAFAKIDLFPNPANDYVQLSAVFVSPPKAVQIQVFDQNGRVLKQQSHDVQSTEFQTILETNDLPRGMYRIQVRTNQGIWTEKLLKM